MTQASRTTRANCVENMIRRSLFAIGANGQHEAWRGCRWRNARTILRKRPRALLNRCRSASDIFSLPSFSLPTDRAGPLDNVPRLARLYGVNVDSVELPALPMASGLREPAPKLRLPTAAKAKRTCVCASRNRESHKSNTGSQCMTTWELPRRIVLPLNT